MMNANALFHFCPNVFTVTGRIQQESSQLLQKPSDGHYLWWEKYMFLSQPCNHKTLIKKVDAAKSVVSLERRFCS